MTLRLPARTRSSLLGIWRKPFFGQDRAEQVRVVLVRMSVLGAKKTIAPFSLASWRPLASLTCFVLMQRLSDSPAPLGSWRTCESAGHFSFIGINQLEAGRKDVCCPRGDGELSWRQLSPSGACSLPWLLSGEGDLEPLHIFRSPRCYSWDGVIRPWSPGCSPLPLVHGCGPRADSLSLLLLLIMVCCACSPVK